MALVSKFADLHCRLEHGGKDKLKLIKFQRDENTVKIWSGWAGDYKSTLSESMGFENDSDETGYSLAVQDFIELLKSEGKLVA